MANQSDTASRIAHWCFSVNGCHHRDELSKRIGRALAAAERKRDREWDRAMFRAGVDFDEIEAVKRELSIIMKPRCTRAKGGKR